MRPVHPLGDTGLVVDLERVDEAPGLARAIEARRWPGIEDVIVGFGSVTVVVDPTVTDRDAVGAMVASLPVAAAAHRARRVIEIPVAFDGPDLDEVAHFARMPAARAVDLLTGTDLRVAFVGFAPGFGYLVGLPPALAAVPRRPIPRPVVPAGSLALAGGFAGVYPQASPGGWNVVGHTALPLFAPDAPPYSVLQADDEVRLRRTEVTGAPPTRTRPPLRSDAARRLVVESPGLLSFVQDTGRLGAARLGVPRGGAADPFALRMANRLVGNDEGAAGIEATARGPSLHFSAPAHVAVVGDAEVLVDGRPVGGHAVIPVDAGQTVTVGVMRQGLRAYVVVGGGLDSPVLLGSRSSDVLSGLGPGALRTGDVLGLGPARRPHGRLRLTAVRSPDAVLRVIVGPDAFPAGTVQRLLSHAWEVDASSDRIGVRLRGSVHLDVPVRRPSSRGMVTGAIQVPPDGGPIVLLCDHATVGGYPVIACVVSADIGVLGQLRPGDAVRLEPVDVRGAVRARAQRERDVRHSVVGWYPVRTD